MAIAEWPTGKKRADYALFIGTQLYAIIEAKKYATDPAARERLAQKVLTGGQGVWGPIPMPPHPRHNIEETRRMVDAILGVK